MTNTTEVSGTEACGCAPGRLGPILTSRRSALRGGLFAALGGGGVALAAPPSPRTEPKPTPEEAVRRLMEGNDRFARDRLTSFEEDLAILRAGTVPKQEPFAAILSCADSRVPVEIIFDQSIGHLFVTRVAGNIATSDIIASLEYGAAVLGVSTIMVLAHQSCGAVKSAIANDSAPGQITTLFPPLRQAVEQGGRDAEAVAKANASIQADLLRHASPLLGKMIAEGSLGVVAGYYALETGRVTLLRRA